MKVIIAGSRNVWVSEIELEAIISESYFDITEEVCGGARGADALGERWAKANCIPVRYFPADWATHGKAAGPIRNKQMAEYADALIALWDGTSPGTLNMIRTMRKLNKPTFLKVINGE